MKFLATFLRRTNKLMIFVYVPQFKLFNHSTDIYRIRYEHYMPREAYRKPYF